LTEELLYSLFFSTKPSWRLSRLFQCVQEQGAEERFVGRETGKGRSVGDWVAVAEREERARGGVRQQRSKGLNAEESPRAEREKRRVKKGPG
jgi:hypothetical protein